MKWKYLYHSTPGEYNKNSTRIDFQRSKLSLPRPLPGSIAPVTGPVLTCFLPPHLALLLRNLEPIHECLLLPPSSLKRYLRQSTGESLSCYQAILGTNGLNQRVQDGGSRISRPVRELLWHLKLITDVVLIQAVHVMNAMKNSHHQREVRCGAPVAR